MTGYISAMRKIRIQQTLSVFEMQVWANCALMKTSRMPGPV